MADQKISARTNASTLAGTEKLAGVQSGADVNVTPAQINTYIRGLLVSPPAIGGTTPAAGSFSNLVATVARFSAQPAPTAKTADATLTIAELLTGIITVTSATAVNLTLPTGTNTDAGVLAGALANDMAFDWVVMNLGSVTGTATIVAGSAHTFVGEAVVPLPTATLSGAAIFRTRKTATNTFVTYRVG